MHAEAGLVDASGTVMTGLRAGLSRRLHNMLHAFAIVLVEGAGTGLLRGVRANVLHSYLHYGRECAGVRAHKAPRQVSAWSV